MKKYSRVLFWCLPCLLALALLSACRGSDNVDDSTGDDLQDFYLTYAYDSDYEEKIVRAGATTPGTVKENQINTLTVAFFDRTTGQKKTFSGVTTPIVFNVQTPTNTEWKDNDPATKTVKIKMSRNEAQNTVVYVFTNLTPNGQNNVKNIIANVAGLEAYKSDFIYNTLNPNRSGLGQQMYGRVELTASDLNAMKVTVPLTRTTTKLTYVLHFAYDELLKNTDARYIYRQFPRWHYIIPRKEIDERRDSTMTISPYTPTYGKFKTPERFDRLQDTVTLGPIFAVPYDISATPTVPAPYVTFELKARRVLPAGTATPIGWLPPPAGGEFLNNGKGYIERDHYYRLVMPRTLKPNTHYYIHVYFVGEGAYNEEGANILEPKFVVADWVEGTYAPVNYYPIEPIVP